MDNAAKVLIIAGGILVGMLIITFSMYLYISFQDAYSVSMSIHDAVEINAFNTYFTKYGYHKDGSSDTFITAADAYNILSRAYEVVNDDDAIVSNIKVAGDAGFSLDFDDPNFYEKRFYYSDSFEGEYRYEFAYNLEGIVDEIYINN